MKPNRYLAAYTFEEVVGGFGYPQHLPSLGLVCDVCLRL
jgi:hypothetical protein